jgi:hypothetical protein
MTPSPSYTLNQHDLATIGWGLLALIGATILTFLISLLPNISFGPYTPLVVIALTPILHAGIQFIKANDANNPAKPLIDALPGDTTVKAQN